MAAKSKNERRGERGAQGSQRGRGQSSRHWLIHSYVPCVPPVPAQGRQQLGGREGRPLLPEINSEQVVPPLQSSVNFNLPRAKQKRKPGEVEAEDSMGPWRCGGRPPTRFVPLTRQMRSSSRVKSGTLAPGVGLAPQQAARPVGEETRAGAWEGSSFLPVGSRLGRDELTERPEGERGQPWQKEKSCQQAGADFIEPAVGWGELGFYDHQITCTCMTSGNPTSLNPASLLCKMGLNEINFSAAAVRVKHHLPMTVSEHRVQCP